jgi:cell division septation protein DedD
MRAAVIAVLLVALGAVSLVGQQPSLRQVESLMAAGDYGRARELLERWFERPPAGEVALRAQAQLTRARLAADPRAAERHYLAVVLDYPMSGEAPEALLRLGQGLLLLGDAERAVAYLERLSVDYPGNPHRVVGRLWLARAYRGLGRGEDACLVARSLLEEARPGTELRPLAESEVTAACPGSAAPAAPAVAAGVPPAPTVPPVARPSAAGRFAVQSGAFRQREGAEALAARLRRAGYDPRLVFVPGSTLLRVRVGRFPDNAAAAALAGELGARGFPTVVVSDADRERAP